MKKNEYIFQLRFVTPFMDQADAAISFRRLVGDLRPLSLSYLGIQKWKEICGPDHEQLSFRKFTDAETLRDYREALLEVIDATAEPHATVFGNDDESLKLMYVTAADTARIAIIESADGLWRIAGRVRFYKDPTVVERVLSKEGNVTFSTTEI